MTATQETVSAIPIMSMMSGLWVSQTLVCAHDLDIFGVFEDRPGATVADVAAHLRLLERPVEQLLTACAALDLLQRHDDGYRNSPMASTYLVRSSPDYFGGWLDMLSKHDYPGWLRLTEALRTNRPTAWDSTRQSSLFDSADPVMVETFWEGMIAVSRPTSRALAPVAGLADARALLDVGGGGGAHAIELSRFYPDLRVTIFDLPFVVELTQKKITEACLEDRVSLTPGDFFNDDLPTGYDAILLSMILHDWDVPDCKQLLGKCFAALPSGGRLLINELLVADTKDGPVDAAMMSLAMLVETFGRNYTGAEYQSWLVEAGFTDIEIRPFTAPGANAVVTARKP